MLLTILFVVTGLVGALVLATEVAPIVRRRCIERRWGRDQERRDEHGRRRD